MNHTRLIKPLIFISIFFFPNVFAQQNSTDSNPGRMRAVHPSVVIVIGVLCTMFCLTFLVLACMKFCQSDVLQQIPHQLPSSRSRFSGIDKKAIESLPFFRFSSLKGSKEGLECVVCLSKFEDSEVLRLLPKCRHAFHMNCIDQWLESHSSCPLCRREHDGSSRSSRFSIGNSFRKFSKSPKEDVLIQYGDQMLDKFKHRIIVSDIVCKSRWSDVNSSDLMFLNSKMLNEVSKKHFSPSGSGRFEIDVEQAMKFKEDMERRRLYESKVAKTLDSGETSISNLQFPRFQTDEEADGMQKRSMSEITNVSRFRETRSSYWASNAKDVKLQSVWLPMAKRTIQWFTNREGNSFEMRS
ncbi:unnamed protein product [Lactuca saligna]|uniref:RING-type E3 ubiquitin transferase n=1 Tax=Lactuca saligna TaxID=75948 RepID=A0AA35YD06_LACSI|nr:unnamed protein product [Lactuca saligna]